MEYWQELLPPAAPGEPAPGTWTTSYPAPLPDGSRLLLPLRDLGEAAVAGLIVNQASFAVLDRLTLWLAQVARRFAPEVVVGVPTLGHALGAAVARSLGHPNWVALGTSRKLWYDESLSVPLASITSPAGGRRLWLDPRLLPRLAGRRALLVDDVVSTGTSLAAGLDLLAAAGVAPVGAAAIMLQGNRWRTRIARRVAVAAVFATPLFRRAPAGWQARWETAAVENCPLTATPEWDGF
jgi:adenine/guanine phosphoribosyltransferase-like PRPP-binding protein